MSAMRPLSSRTYDSLYKLKNRGMRHVRREFASSVQRQADFTHAVIGGGAVGLAIARRLAARGGTSTVLLERNEAVGMETSSRNSEVIHAGLYYGETSLKTQLCVRGKELMYSLCQKKGIPHRNTGKWIVAQTSEQGEELSRVHGLSRRLGVPTKFIPLSVAAKLEPSVRAEVGVLESPSTGIVDSHAYMQYLHQSFTARGGDTALNTAVTHIAPLGRNGTAGWELTCQDKASGDPVSVSTETVINAAGLGACDIHNMIVAPPLHRRQYYAKGNYFSYSAPAPRPSRLIYPAPEKGLAGLGTHLTLDMAGDIRFGPDSEWVDTPHDLTVNDARLPAAIQQIRQFLPDVDAARIVPGYAGIRPKLERQGAVGEGKGFVDFYVRKEAAYEGWINLLGIESPGLTSSLAMAEMVEGLLYR